MVWSAGEEPGTPGFGHREVAVLCGVQGPEPEGWCEPLGGVEAGPAVTS